MKNLVEENLTSNDRVTCISVGIMLSIAILLLPFESTWIAAFTLIAVYPLLTGLTAIDPVLALVESIKPKKSALVKKSTPSVSLV